MKRQQQVLAATLIALATCMGAAQAEEADKAAAAQPSTATTNPEQVAASPEQVAEMQKNVEKLQADIARLQAERSELQKKIQQAEADIASKAANPGKTEATSTTGSSSQAKQEGTP